MQVSDLPVVTNQTFSFCKMFDKMKGIFTILVYFTTPGTCYPSSLW